MTEDGKIEATHTPGDWAVHSEDLRGGKYWCVFIPGKKADGEWYDTIDLHEDENGEANARLIAAAPDMRAALESLCNFAWTAVRADCNESREYLNSLIQTARDAIAKAEDR